jgi:hypothetical protein
MPSDMIFTETPTVGADESEPAWS